MWKRLSSVTHTTATRLGRGGQQKLSKTRVRTLAANTPVGKIESLNLTVVGTGANGTSPSFNFHCKSYNYLFNCGANCIRMAYSNGLYQRPTSICITRAAWENVAGLTNFFFSISEEDRQSIKYYWPDNCESLMDIHRQSCGHESFFRLTDHDQHQNDLLQIAMINLDVPNQNGHDSVVYHFKTIDLCGKFNPEKAISLGVPEGPAFGHLVMGKSFVTESGDVVHPSQVVEPRKKGPSFLVVDCPDENVLEALYSNKELQPTSLEGGDALNLIVHITPLSLIQSRRYSSWLSSFGDNVNHLFLHSSICPGEIGLKKLLSFSMPFHLGNSNVYGLPFIPPVKKVDLNVFKVLHEKSLILGQTGLKYCFLKDKVDLSKTHLPLKEYVKSAYGVLEESEAAIDKIRHYNKSVSAFVPWNAADIPSFLMNNKTPSPLVDADDCMVTVLGSGSSEIMAIRNESGYLVQTKEDGNILLDCGDGTLQQLYACFGHSRAQNILENLRCIFISHYHPDHHCDLVCFLHEIAKMNTPVTIIAPGGILRLASTYNMICKNLTLRMIPSSDLRTSVYRQGSLKIRTVPVKHINMSHAAIISRGNQWHMVYSGDTKLCPKLIREGMDATLLIHEGTYDDAHEVLTKGTDFHCTYADAVKAAKRMNAKLTIVTHFSPVSFLHAPLEKEWGRGIVPAIDLMSVKFSDFHEQGLDSAEIGAMSRAISDSHFLEVQCK